MKVRTPDQIEKLRITFGSAAIVFAVCLSTAIVMALGVAQMA